MKARHTLTGIRGYVCDYKGLTPAKVSSEIADTVSKFRNDNNFNDPDLDGLIQGFRDADSEDEINEWIDGLCEWATIERVHVLFDS